MNKINKRITILRAEMQKLDLDAFYISGTDPHSSEYLPENWKTREYISGFSGSYGVVVITQVDAIIWTDARYFIQAEEQLKGTEFRMQKLRIPGAILPEEWLAENLKSGSKVGIDAQTVTKNTFTNLNSVLVEKGIEIQITNDLFDSVWENRPSAPLGNIFELDVSFAGKTRVEKYKMLARELEILNSDYHIITMLDELAWQFNLRGSDISYNPVFVGYGIVGNNENYLFVHGNKIDVQLKNRLEKEGVVVKNYDEFYPFLKELKNKTIYIDSNTANFQVYSSLFENNEIIEGTSKIALLKSLKNKTEIDGFKNAMRKDGVALVEFLFWLKNNLGETLITEYTFGQKLKEFRSKQKGFKGESFPPIVGFKEHGAIVHLTVDADNALEIEKEGIVLFDSGGQYLDGTTDITRTIALGEITRQQKIEYTLVLKGMIALTNAIFPEGTLGSHLDILARKPLWENGLNYGHGTGHGVGHFLNVHEGPMSIRQEYNPASIQPGMVLSNEPAFYREGEYGIRTENMIICVEKETTDYGKFLGFETLTLCPIETRLIDFDLLLEKEIDWLNNYHEKVKTILKPLLNKALHKFLDELTQPI